MPDEKSQAINFVDKEPEPSRRRAFSRNWRYFKMACTSRQVPAPGDWGGSRAEIGARQTANRWLVLRGRGACPGPLRASSVRKRKKSLCRRDSSEGRKRKMPIFTSGPLGELPELRGRLALWEQVALHRSAKFGCGCAWCSAQRFIK